MDCSIVKTKFDGILMVTTTDFFYPLVDDPYLQGKIACANVLSDLYSMGIEHCDTMLMLLAASTEMPKELAFKATEWMMKGFTDLAKEAGTSVTGGQSVRNPWPIIGGVATSICKESDFIRPIHGVVGDVLVLTKACGMQIVSNASQWLMEGVLDTKLPLMCAKFGLDGLKSMVREMQTRAIAQMARLNRVGARAMRTHGAHGATDVTGFGLLGHARNLAKSQRNAVRIRIDRMPVLRHALEIAAEKPNFGLVNGTSAETSGGLLVMLPESVVDAFIKDVKQGDGEDAWRVGVVISANSLAERDAFFAPDVNFFEV